MTRETLTRRLPGRRTNRRGIDHRPPLATRSDEHDALLDDGVHLADTASAPPPEPPVETDWSAHRMASFLVLLAGYASEEPVRNIDPKAMGDVISGGVIERRDGRWTVNAHGRDILEKFRLDQPIPLERRPATEQRSTAAAAQG
jgi:hypothetical protein